MSTMPEILSDPIDYKSKEQLYIALRKAEGRLYSDEQLSCLPMIEPGHAHAKEWKYRAHSLKRFSDYLIQKQRPLSILDLGCGNGWMSNTLSSVNNSTVTAIDLNMEELQQAVRVFGQNNRLRFVYGDIFKDILTPSSFDIIVCSSAIQYFASLTDLSKRLMLFLKPDGEIHYLDSPVYSEMEVTAAQKRSKTYYTKMGFEGLAAYYHHHTWNELQEFNYKVLNGSFFSWFQRKISGYPYFLWIRLRK